jgi:hypothetical protein
MQGHNSIFESTTRVGLLKLWVQMGAEVHHDVTTILCWPCGIHTPKSVYSMYTIIGKISVGQIRMAMKPKDCSTSRFMLDR